MRWFGAPALFLLLLTASIGIAQESLNVDFVGCLPGTIEDTHIQGDYAYCATLCGLMVLDVSTSTKPVQAAFLPLYHENEIFLSYHRGITVEGDFAYLVGPWGPLWIVDISDPTSPFVAGRCDAPEYGYNVVTGNGHAYVTDEHTGLRIIDVSDPTAPVQDGFLPFTGRAKDLDLVGTTVYVTVDLEGLRIVDVSEPTAPIEIGACEMGGSCRNVDVEGDIAYVTRIRSMIIIEVSEPTAPVEIGTYIADDYDSVYDVDVVGDYAFLSSSDPGLRVVDVSDPTAPTEVGTCEVYGSNIHLMVDGSNAYVTGGYRGLHIVDINKPEAPTDVGWYFTLGIAADAQVQGDYAYVVGGYSCGEKDGAPKEGTAGFFVVGIDEPTLPVVTGFSPIYSPTSGVAVDGSHACAVTGYGGFYCYDVSDPSSPDELSGITLAGEAKDVELVGDLAYLVHFGLRIMDISNPVEPVEIALFHEHQATSDVQVIGPYAYLAEALNGLIVVDVSDPTDPREVGSAVTPSRAEGVAVGGNYAYVADWFSGLVVFDISDPTAPVPVGECPTPEYAFDVAVSGRFAYVADEFAGIRVVDVSDPSAPVEVGFYKILNPISSVTAHEEYITVAAGYGGLFVLRNGSTVGLEPEGSTPVLPQAYALRQNHPNPFNPYTTVRYELPEPAAVSFRIYDVTGHLVRALLSGETVSPGLHEAAWNGRDDSGRDVATGVYFYRFETATYAETRRMTRVK